MPLHRFALLIAVVIALAGVTIWLGATLAAMLGAPAPGWLAAVPPVLVALVALRMALARRSD